jgi:hypothetical protein
MLIDVREELPVVDCCTIVEYYIEAVVVVVLIQIDYWWWRVPQVYQIHQITTLMAREQLCFQIPQMLPRRQVRGWLIQRVPRPLLLVPESQLIRIDHRMVLCVL